jgi:hypothetical protein
LFANPLWVLLTTAGGGFNVLIEGTAYLWLLAVAGVVALLCFLRLRELLAVLLKDLLAKLPHEDLIGGAEGNEFFGVVILEGVEFVLLALGNPEADDVLSG